jgi:hypothetical protein
MCPREIEAPAAHSQGVARPTVASLLVHCKARNSRALGSTRRDATGGRCVRGPWLRCQATAGRVSGGGVSLLFQRRLAPPRALRRTSLGSSAPGHGFSALTGLPSRSALAAPPLRLAALRWRAVVCASLESVVGHRRASRRPAWSLLQRTSPSRASRGLPPLRMCPHEIEAPAAHSQGVARPTVASTSRALQGT